MNDLHLKNLRDYSGFTTTPEGWMERTVGEICNLGRGRVINQEEINENPGSYPVFSSQTRNNGQMGSLATFDLSGEYVTWTTDGENAGTVFFRSGQFNCTNVCGTLLPKDKNNIELRFLAYHLGRVAKRYVSYIGNPKLMNGVMASIALILPQPEVQNRIVEILSSVDRTIAKTEALIEKYQQIKAGLMHDLFTRGIGADGKLRPPREVAPELYKNSAIGWIPKEWEVEILDRLTQRGSGHTPNKNIDSYWNGGLKWVSLADSRKLDNLYIFDTDLEISELGIQNSSAVIHPRGTVIMTRDAGVGKSAIISEPMAVSQHFMTWRCGESMNNYFLYYWLQYNKRMFENVAMGSTIVTIGLPYFKKLKIAVPISKTEQEKIGKKLRFTDTHIFSLKSDLEKLKYKKSGLMNDLLTGKVSVNVDSDAS